MPKHFLAAALVLLVLSMSMTTASAGSPLLGTWQQVSDDGLVGWGNVMTITDDSHIVVGKERVPYHAQNPTHISITRGAFHVVLTIQVSGDRLITTSPYSSAYIRVRGRTPPLDRLPSPMEGRWRQVSNESLNVQDHATSQGHLVNATLVTRPGDIVQFHGTSRHGTMRLHGRDMPYTFVNAEYFTVRLDGVTTGYAVRTHTAHLLALVRPAGSTTSGIIVGPVVTFQR